MSKETLEMMSGQNIADPSEGGLLDALDRHFDGEPEPKQEPVKQEPAKEEPVKKEPVKEEPAKQEPTKEEPSKGEPKVEEKKAEVPKIEIEEEFTIDGDDKSPEDGSESFDEKVFDQETEKLAEGLEAKAGDKFKALRAELKEAKQKTLTPEVQKRIDELELKASEADGLRKRIEELSNVSAKTRMESTPEFAEQVKKPADGLFADVKKMAERYEGDPQFLWKLVTLQDHDEQAKAFEEHLSDFSDFDKVEVRTMIKSWNNILDKRDELLDSAQKYIDGLDARQAEEAQKVLDENRRNVQAIQKDIWTKYKDVIPGFVDENGKETQAFKDLMNKSMAVDFTRANARNQAFAAFSGTILKHLVEEMNKMAQRLAEYESEDLRQAKATSGTGAAVNNASSGQKEAAPQSFRDMFVNADLD